MCAKSLQTAGLLRPWDSPGKNTGVGCHALQEIVPTQGRNPSLLHLLQRQVGSLTISATWEALWFPQISHGPVTLYINPAIGEPRCVPQRDSPQSQEHPFEWSRWKQRWLIFMQQRDLQVTILHPFLSELVQLFTLEIKIMLSYNSLICTYFSYNVLLQFLKPHFISCFSVIPWSPTV